MKNLKLKSVRPYIFENLILSDHDIKMDDCISLADSVSQYVDRYIENELMPKVAEQLTGMLITLLNIFIIVVYIYYLLKM